jgi:hypothetical protein
MAVATHTPASLVRTQAKTLATAQKKKAKDHAKGVVFHGPAGRKLKIRA